MERPIISYEDETIADAVGVALVAKKIGAAVKSVSDQTRTIYTVVVDEPEHEKAMAIIEAENHAAEAVHCPSCNSINVEFPARPRASILMNAVSKVADVIAPSEKQQFCCGNCSEYWD